ncbi:MAG: NAD(P)H-hydrate dehydratase [Opitutales bacterium]
MNPASYNYPVLSCEASLALEKEILPDEAAEWAAMRKAGEGVAEALVCDYRELRQVPERLRVLALLAKGNNSGDALIACSQLLADFPRAEITLLRVSEPEDMRPLARQAYERIAGRVKELPVASDADSEAILQQMHKCSEGRGFDIVIDGLLGMTFRPPVREPIRSVIEAVNAYEAIGLRAAIDVPSGKGDDSDNHFFRADFSYATGVVKKVLLSDQVDCGRVRFVDLGFFRTEAGSAIRGESFFLQQDSLRALRQLRPASADKRTYGHLFIVGGSTGMPGALMMTVQAAVRSGVGLVTVFAPASVVSKLAAHVPEAMWRPWPEMPNGTLNPRAMGDLLRHLDRATAVIVGPGMGQGRNTEAIAQKIVQTASMPVLLDADALRLRVVELVAKRKSSFGPVVITPHAGEFLRLTWETSTVIHEERLLAFCRNYQTIAVLKGPFTRICNGEAVFYNPFGGPVLSRGGSGDLLAGLIGGLLAQSSTDAQTAAAQGVALHGMAAELLARERGQVTVHTTQLLDYLSEALRGADC